MSDSPFALSDDLGPAKLMYLHRPAVGLKAVVAIDNTACGPAIGGVRMAPDVSAKEAFRLARAMTLKNAAAGLAHGGGKSVIYGDPHIERLAKEKLMRAFACEIADLRDYIPGPDMGTDETCMGWIHDEIGRAVGLPRSIGGIPLDEIGATGFGLTVAVEEALKKIGLEPKGARVAVQGFGAVGKHAARFLAEKGAVLVGASDSTATVTSADGLDIASLISLKERGGHFVELGWAANSDPEAVIDVACDVWIPAARPDVIRADNAARLNALIVAEGANVPCTEEAEAMLARRGILVLPDFIANAGGVICASVEFHGGSERAAFETIESKIRANTRAMLERTGAKFLPRAAALEIARARISNAMHLRRFA